MYYCHYRHYQMVCVGELELLWILKRLRHQQKVTLDPSILEKKNKQRNKTRKKKQENE